MRLFRERRKTLQKVEWDAGNFGNQQRKMRKAVIKYKVFVLRRSISARWLASQGPKIQLTHQLKKTRLMDEDADASHSASTK